MSFNELHLGTGIRGRLSPCILLSCVLLSVLVLLCLTPSASAQSRVLETVTFEDAQVGKYIGPKTLLQADPEGVVTPESIKRSKGRILSGKINDGNFIHLGYSGHTHWLTFKLRGNNGSNPITLNLGNVSGGRKGYIKTLNVYSVIPHEEETIIKQINPVADGVYKLPAPDNNSERIFAIEVKAAAGRPAILPIKVFTETSYLKNLADHPNTLYIFALTSFAVFFIASFLSTGNRSNLSYAIYFITLSASWWGIQNFGIKTGSFIPNAVLLMTPLIQASTIIFITKSYWNIAKTSHSEKHILNALLVLNIIVPALSFFIKIDDGLIYSSFFVGMPIMTVLIVMLMSLAQSRSQNENHPFFFYSLVPVFIGLSLSAASTLKVLPESDLLLKLYWLALIPQGFLLIIAAYKNSSRMMTAPHSDLLNANDLKRTKDTADHSRLLKVIEKEREILAQFKAKEEQRVQDMERAKEEADEANRAKSAFLAVVSHEIRTPMTGVMGMVRLLLDSSISKQQRDYVLTIQESSEAMMGLLNDILDFEKIQRGKIELEEISFDLQRLIQGVVTLMSGHAAQKNISLSARVSEDIPRFVKGDPTRLRQILLNLMGNAIKFTSKGGVTLIVKNIGIVPGSMSPTRGVNNSSSKNFMLYFGIQDSGIGISPEAQENLFNPFSQADSSISRKFGGTGLGLAISKGLVEKMGGTININSKENEGSTFFFTLNMQEGAAIVQETRQKPVYNEHNAAPLHVLVVDDNAITRKVVVTFLEQDGHSIEQSESAEEAIEKINKSGFDIVLMDVELPGMRGNEAAKIIRQHPDPAKSTLPIIAMTGNVGKEDTDSYLADGMTAILNKPIDPDKLKSIVREYAPKKERHILAPKQERPTPTPQNEIMMAPSVAKEPLVIPENVFNPEMLQSLKDAIGQDQLQELLDELLVKTDEILGQMDQASKDGDIPALAARAHELKGMAGNFGLIEISDIAAQAELKAKSEQLEGIAQLVGTLPDANDRAKSALKDWASH